MHGADDRTIQYADSDADGDTEARYHHELCGGTPLNKYCS